MTFGDGKKVSFYLIVYFVSSRKDNEWDQDLY